MRHSRADAFRAAAASPPTAARWSDVASDPNDPGAVAQRAATLAAAWRPAVPDRVAYLEQRCRAKRVLDIGCVAHDVARMSSGDWLHGRLAAVASSCLGVDVHGAGVEEMNRRGFRAVVHDLGHGIGPLADAGPFEVIVAGELIEHVESVSMLFTTANALLAADGELVLTSPNPWAPHRVRAGQRGDVWENTDHIFLAFPSGIAELAERHGLVLAEATTTAAGRVHPSGGPVRRLKRWIKGSRWLTVGYRTDEELTPVRVIYGRLGSILHGAWWPRRRFVGETFIYVVRRRAASLAEPGSS